MDAFHRTVQTVRKILKQHFGFGDFREPQQQVVASVLEGRDTLVIMPTGGGKSLCYQLPALVMEGTTLVVSPLIALMKDQVDTLQKRGIAAAMINSSQSWAEQKVILEQMRRDRLKLVYVSPERFRAGSFMRALEGVRIAMLAIDEAHCISQWGHDFRPDYMRLGSVLRQLGRPPCSAFTATATPDVREDIERQLGLSEPVVFVSGFARDNLSFNISEVKTKAEKFKRIRSLVKAHGTGIVYCATRKSVEAVSEYLEEGGITHCAYHAGLSASDRKAAQDRFMQKEVPVAVATSAFGMGIDRADIRFVCHYEMPGSVEAFYQEAGRAGRDGKAAHCEMLFMYADKRVQDFFVDGANPDIRSIRAVYDLLRSHGDTENEVVLSVDELTARLTEKSNPMAVQTALGHLAKGGYIERFDVPGKQQRGTRLLQPQLNGAGLELPESGLREKKLRDEAKLKAVIQMGYAKECRQAWILRYFGELVAADCGRCDRCTANASTRTLDADELLVVRKALSGIARMCQRISRYEWRGRYGRTRIAECLAGKAGERLSQSGLDQLPTFGILKDFGAKKIGPLLDAMEQAGLIVTEHDEYPLMQLTQLGAQVMFEERTIAMEWPEAVAADNRRAAGKGGGSGKAGAANSAGGAGIGSVTGSGSGTGSGRSAPRRKNTTGTAVAQTADEALYGRLVALRDRMRRARGNAPAYTIFPNTVLQQLAAEKPTDAEEAMQIKGIGPAKAASILPEFLKLIHEASHSGES